MGLIAASVGIACVGLGLVWEGAKNLTAPPNKKGQTPSKATGYITIGVGVFVVLAGILLPFLA